MQSIPINRPQFDQLSSPSFTPIVRSDGADHALGFAQIMQAFDAPSPSPIAESISETQDRDQQAQLADQESNERVESQSEPPEKSGSPTDTPISNDQRSAQSVAEGQIQGESMVESEDSPEVVAKIEGTNEHEAAMRLLENQSEQAKLSIKGLVRSMIHASTPDLTTLAVNTELGSAPGPKAPPPPASTDQSHTNTQNTPTNRDTNSAQPTAPNQAPPPSTDALSAPSPVEGAQSSPVARAGRVDPRVIETSTNAAQTQSQRADVAAGVAQTVGVGVGASTPSQSTNANQNAARLTRIEHSEPQQVVRAPTGAGAGDVGNQAHDPQGGSLVAKVKGAQLPSETHRAGVMAQVQRGLASMLRSGSSEMTLKLTPGHLGEVRIRIKSDGDRLRIRFETSSKEASEHLASSAKELGAHLRAKGIGVDHIQIEHTHPPEPASTQTHGGFDLGNSDQQPQSSPEDQSRQSSQHSGSHAEHLDSEIAEHPDSEQPAPVWTELGLDAIA